MLDSTFNRNSVCGSGQLLVWPIDRSALKLQSASKPPIGQPLTVDNSR